MPIFDIPVKEFPRHVLQPIVRQQIHQIIKDFGLTSAIKDNIFIKYGFSATSKTKDKYKNININGNRVDVDVDVSLNPENTKWEMLNFKYNPGYGFPAKQLSLDRAMFADPDAGIFVYLHEVPCVITLNINFTFLSRTTAFTMMSSHYEMHGGENTWYVSDIMYDLPINNEVIRKLYGLFKLRDFDLTKINFDEYLLVGSLLKLSKRVNRTNTDKEIIFKKCSCQILKDIELTAEKPQENNDNEGTVSFTVPFTLTLQFARPAFYTMIYPITIMNNMVPVQYLPVGQEINDNIRNIEFVKSHLEKTTYEYWQNVYKGYDFLFQSPFYDDWREPQNSSFKEYTQRPFWIIAVTLDEDEHGNALNETRISLFDKIVDNYTLHPIVREIIGIQSCESYEDDCLFNISVFRNDVQYNKSELGWDIDEMNVVLKSKDKSKRFHIVISEMVDLNYLNPKWDFIIKRYSDFFDKRNDNDIDIDNIINGGSDNGNYITPRILHANFITRRSEIQR